jgi:hypothetical protein
MNKTVTNGHAPRPLPWNTQSVRSFFEQIPWTGIPLPSLEPSQNAAASPKTSSMCLSVREFFGRFAWDGKSEIAAPIVPPETQTSSSTESSLTLDGFADLF